MRHLMPLNLVTGTLGIVIIRRRRKHRKGERKGGGS
jgi:hypothetical protein